MNPLTCGEDEEPRAQHLSSITVRRQKKPPYRLLFVSAICALVGFIMGAYVQRSRSITRITTIFIEFWLYDSDMFLLVGTASSRFELNKTFIEAPSPETNAAWSSLVPCKCAILSQATTNKAQWAEVSSLSTRQRNLYRMLATVQSFQGFDPSLSSIRFIVWCVVLNNRNISL